MIKKIAVNYNLLEDVFEEIDLKYKIETTKRRFISKLFFYHGSKETISNFLKNVKKEFIKQGLLEELKKITYWIIERKELINFSETDLETTHNLKKKISFWEQKEMDRIIKEKLKNGKY